MFYVNIFLISFSIVLLVNCLILKIISVIDYEVLGLNSNKNSFGTICKQLLKLKSVSTRFLILSCIFIIFNFVILVRIFNNFSFILLYKYIKFYCLFLFLYVCAFIDYLTYYVYSILSYPLIAFSLVTFILSFLQGYNLKSNLETLFLVIFFYLLINKLKFLGEGDFDIILIVLLNLGAFPTIFIFYLSILISGFFGIYLLIKYSFKIKNTKMAFVPFIFLATSIFIILNI